MHFFRKKGFTLLELMIVVIIVGILASLALPRFIRATKKAKEAEAKAILGTIRSAQLRYYLEHDNVYHYDADLSDGSGLDIDITDSRYYTYIAVDGVNDILGQAEANTGGAGAGLDNLQIDIDGNITTY